MSALFYMTNQFRIKELPELLTLTFDLNYTQKSKKNWQQPLLINILKCAQKKKIKGKISSQCTCPSASKLKKHNKMHRFSIIKSLEIFSLCSLKYSFRLSLMLSSSNFRKHRNPCWKTLRKRNAQISYPINSASFSEHYKKYFGLHLRVTSNTFKKVVYTTCVDSL